MLYFYVYYNIINSNSNLITFYLIISIKFINFDDHLIIKFIEVIIMEYINHFIINANHIVLISFLLFYYLIR